MHKDMSLNRAIIGLKPNPNPHDWGKDEGFSDFSNGKG